MLRGLIPFSFSLLLSCNDQGFKSLTDPERGSESTQKAPKISTSPTAIDFGMHLSLDPAIQRTVRIVNVGTDSLLVEPLEITNDNPGAFTWLNPPQPLVLEPQEQHENTVLFLASDPFHQAEISISSNDPDQPIVSIPMFGTGAAPELAITPNPLDMGSVEIGCHLNRDISLLNQGLEALNIATVSTPSGIEFTMEPNLSFPLTLAPGESEIIQVSFTPSDIASYTAQMSVFSNDPDGGMDVIELMAEGDANIFEESWVVAEAPKSDIVFSVDLSGSMSDEQVALGQQFQTFITELSYYTNDWQVMVVNADHGCNHSGILTETTPNYEGIFLDAVQTGAYDISFTEALLTAVANGVEKTDANECNDGFLRQNAMLHIIMLSDECEQSPNPGICGTQWQSYVDRIINQKGDPNLVRMSAVAGDYPSGCSTTGLPNSLTAEFGSGYYEASLATGGLFISICSDWTDPFYLQQLASASVSQDVYELANSPIIDSIEVSVNGTVLSTGWSYDSLSNSVTLDVQPPALSQVDISYYASPNCNN